MSVTTSVNTLVKIRRQLLAFTSLVLIAGGCTACSASDEKASNSPPSITLSMVDTSRLPRMAGAKLLFADPAATMTIVPGSVAQAADATAKLLAADGWQQFYRVTVDENRDIRQFKKGHQGLSVNVGRAPAQGNATGVGYTAMTLDNDLPFPSDASDIAFEPHKLYLKCVTAGSIETTREFFNNELAALGWSRDDKASSPADAKDAKVALIYYTHANQNSLQLALTRRDDGRIGVEINPVTASLVAARTHQKIFERKDPFVDTTRLPRPDDAEKFTTDNGTVRSRYEVPRPAVDTTELVTKLLVADGWQQYSAPLDDGGRTNFKKDAQGLDVRFFWPSEQRTMVEYQAERLYKVLPFPHEATDIVFDTNRPYLGCVTSGSVDQVFDFMQKQLAASGWWSPLSADDIAARWPNAKVNISIENGALAYYVGQDQTPVVLTVRRRDDNKIDVEVKVPPFAQVQHLAVSANSKVLPVPEPHKSSSTRSGEFRSEVAATVPAEVDTVLAFYRRELGKRGWKEETQGAVIKADEVTLTFSSAEGIILLNLGHKYDLTTTHAVMQVPESVIAAKAKAKKDAEEAALRAKQAALAAEGSLNAMAEKIAPIPVPETATDISFDGAKGELKYKTSSSVQGVAAFYREALKRSGWKEPSSAINQDNFVALSLYKGKDVLHISIQNFSGTTNVRAYGALQAESAEASRDQEKPLRALAENVAPIPVPETAKNVDFDGADGSLRFGSSSSVRAVADFYRGALKPLGWKEQPSVINTATLVEFDLTKGKKKIFITIRQASEGSDVTAHGSGLETSSAQATDTAPAASASGAITSNGPDFEAEEVNGLPVPKRHTLSVGSKSSLPGSQATFRRELTASIPADLGAVLSFYRRELAKRDWKETTGAAVASDHAVLAFSSSEGPAVLKLGRKEGETMVDLAQKIPAAAGKAGVLPPPGQAKVLFGNIGDADAIVEIDKHTIKVAAGAGGPKSANFPTLNLAPGKYKFSLKVAGGPVSRDELEVGADDTWGLMIAPGGGGAAQLHLY